MANFSWKSKIALFSQEKFCSHKERWDVFVTYYPALHTAEYAMAFWLADWPYYSWHEINTFRVYPTSEWCIV